MGNFESALQVAASTKWSAFVAMAIATAFIAFRAGSIHSVLENIWRLVAGKTDVENPALRKLLQEDKDLEKFRFVYGIKINKTNQLNTFLSWLKYNNITVGQAKKAWRWIKIDDIVHISVPGPSFFVISASVFTVIIIILCASFRLLSYSDAVYKFNESGIWFSVDKQSVHHVFETQRIDLSLCEKGPNFLVDSMHFTDREAASLCQASKSGEIAQVVSDGIKEQRWTGLALYVVGFVLFTWILLRHRSANEAKSISAITNAREIEPTGATAQKAKRVRSASPVT